jgi:tetratricopeptide (TPR) repeat protein
MTADDYCFDLGSYSRLVTTCSKDAQLWFDRGLMWCYGYNHAESVNCFRKAVEYDPNCPMAFWGIAHASGSNYNKPWTAFGEQERVQAVADAHQATKAALALLESASPIEQALITALENRFQSDQVVSMDEFQVWNEAYAEAMKKVYDAFSNDLDVSSIYAEALINRTPWALWDLKSGEPAKGADTLDAIRVLESAMKQVESQGEKEVLHHPGVLHMYIHVMEMSPHPERALRACDALRDLVPHAGHLLHMPSHIDILCGQYYNGVVANNKAIVADTKFVKRNGPLNFYTLYRCHDYHFKIYAAMFMGQYHTALEAAIALNNTIPEDLLRVEDPPMAAWLEGFRTMKMHVLIRFGKWQAIIDEPLPNDLELYCVSTAMIHYAKTVAHAASGDIEAAEEEKNLFEAAFSKVPESRFIFNIKCIDILAVAAEMMHGELEYRKGNCEKAFDHLRKSVELDDNLPFDEPWGWMQPVRHALGALLLEQGQVEEAEKVYRADLGLDKSLSRPSQHPENVWSLHGYVECLHRLNKHKEATAAQARLDLAMARADVQIHASSYCRRGVALSS